MKREGGNYLNLAVDVLALLSVVLGFFSLMNCLILYRAFCASNHITCVVLSAASLNLKHADYFLCLLAIGDVLILNECGFYVQMMSSIKKVQLQYLFLFLHMLTFVVLYVWIPFSQTVL